MIEIEFIGKTLLITEGKEKVVVIGDLHLGYEQSLRSKGYLVPNSALGEMKKELEEIFSSVGKVDKIILLGDLKHEFGRILWDEWQEIRELVEFLRGKLKSKGEIVILKGNHDKIVEPIVKKMKKRNVKVVDYLLWKGNAFVHGDKDFERIYDKRVTRWVIGHAHPAVTLREGRKRESYKCFLVGNFKGKEIVIVPSFFSLIAGTDARDFDLGLEWDFDLMKFRALVVADLKVLDFGKLGDIKS